MIFMTVSQIRELMYKHIVPEAVMPQNISALLHEESTQPETDAYTFLNRVRALGIGVQDFLYLLKGCDAPAEAVEKIEQNPAMSLQALIVTLDGAGLTPQDYTRMLYTARQLWERTITMRLGLEDIEEINVEDSEPKLVSPQEQKEKFEREYRKNNKTAEADENKSPAAEPVKTARQKKKNEREFYEYEGVRPIGSQRNSEVYTAVQKKAEPQEAPEADETENIPDLPPDYPDEEKPKGSKGAIAVAAILALTLCGLNVGLDHFGFEREEQKAGYKFAEDRAEIFTELHTAYNAQKIGGETAGFVDNGSVFGDLLISSGDQLGVFSFGNSLLVTEKKLLTLYNNGGSVEISPPDGAEFVRVEAAPNGTAAIYGGDNFCGIMRIDSGGVSYRSEQSGTLTDIYSGGDFISLGSVYTPQFVKTFSIEEEMCYLPWTSLAGEAAPLSVGEIIAGNTAQGCSYAVNVQYSLESGEITQKTAILGDPLFSAAEKPAAVLREQEGGLIVTLNDEGQPISKACECDRISAADFYNGYIITAEISDESPAVLIRDNKLELVSGFVLNEASMLYADNDTLLIGKDGVAAFAVDISNPAAPSPVELTAKFGRISGDYAVCAEKNKGGISLSLYKTEDKKAALADSFTKTLSKAELETLSFIGANAMLADSPDLWGAAYTWFDGVSVVEEFAQMGKSRTLKTEYDSSPRCFAVAAGDGEPVFIYEDN